MASSPEVRKGEVLELLRTHPVDYCILTWRADNPEEGIHEQLASQANAGGSVIHVVRQLTQDKVVKWMIDSGASFHLIHARAVRDEVARVRPCSRSISVDTAHGKIVLDREVDSHIPTLQETVTARLGQTSSNILSLGRLCQEHGCSLHWGSFEGKPRLWDARGRN